MGREGSPGGGRGLLGGLPQDDYAQPPSRSGANDCFPFSHTHAQQTPSRGTTTGVEVEPFIFPPAMNEQASIRQ